MTNDIIVLKQCVAWKGCRQCVNIAPDNFTIDNDTAKCFKQPSNTAEQVQVDQAMLICAENLKCHAIVREQPPTPVATADEIAAAQAALDAQNAAQPEPVIETPTEPSPEP